MAKVKITVIKCDKCGFEEADPSKFFRVVVAPVPVDGKKVKNFSDRDLCESCVGLPGVNRDK